MNARRGFRAEAAHRPRGGLLDGEYLEAPLAGREADQGDLSGALSHEGPGYRGGPADEAALGLGLVDADDAVVRLGSGAAPPARRPGSGLRVAAARRLADADPRRRSSRH